jgi:hypothetical protein
MAWKLTADGTGSISPEVIKPGVRPSALGPVLAFRDQLETHAVVNKDAEECQSALRCLSTARGTMGGILESVHDSFRPAITRLTDDAVDSDLGGKTDERVANGICLEFHDPY